MEKGQTIEGHVTAIAFGGSGIIRHEGIVIFLPFVAVGDHVKARITHCKKRFARAELVELIESGPLRIKPKCEYYGHCGGCQFQHLQAEEQIKIKCEHVQDAFLRLAKPSIIITPKAIDTDKRWSYRRHIKLSLVSDESHFLCGYVSADSTEIVKVLHCPIFSEQSTVIKEVQTIVEKLKPNRSGEKGSVRIVKTGKDKFVLVFSFERTAAKGLEALLKAAVAKYPHWQACILKDAQSTKKWGEVQCGFSLQGMVFSYSPEAFVQAHPEQSEKLYSDILKACEGGGKSVLDLYCGIGVTSILLANKGYNVTAMEISAVAITEAKENAKQLTGEKPQFVRSDVAKIPAKYMKARYDILLVNPPRTGMDASVHKSIQKLKPKRIVYVSCMPSTLARDLTDLQSCGYTVKSARSYEMFPQSSHVETLVVLDL
jgi:23S rRNA (uracil1939-C5)-methyltransferase